MGRNGKNKGESTVVVPWFSMAEWKEVYKQIYSHDGHLQRKGYERLLVWKARCPTLPAGVECTLALMLAHLYDQEVRPQISSGQLPIYREQDLKLMFATTIMRFLNHISGVAQLSTLYAMARNVNIPRWFVQIRHCVAHDMTMPPLSVLREALQVAFAWTNENYWKYETDVTKNYVALEVYDNSDNKQIVTKLLHLIELWQALKLYAQVGFEDMKSIPCEKIRLDIYNFMATINSQGNPKVEPLIVPCAESKMENHATGKVLFSMKKKIESFFLRHKNIFTEDKSLTVLLLEGETFLLTENLISSLNIDETDTDVNLPIKLCVLWEELLQLLQVVKLLPSLLIKLIVLSGEKGESAHRRKVAAIWAGEICSGIAKAKEMEHVKEKMIRESTPIGTISFKSKLGRFKLRKEFEKYHPGLATAITLRPLNLPIVDLDLVELAMNEPSTYTKIFLPRLLKIAEPALSKMGQGNLLRVLDIYTANSTGFQPKATETFTPFTVKSLKALIGDPETADLSDDKILQPESVHPEMADLSDDKMPQPESVHPESADLSDDEMPQPESVHPESADSENHGIWSRCEDYHQWELSPIGVLPWQRHQTLVEFSLPPETVWTVKQVEPASEEITLKRKDLSVKKTDWESPYFEKHSKKFRGEVKMPSMK